MTQPQHCSRIFLLVSKTIDRRKLIKGPEMDHEEELRKEHYKQQGVIRKQKD